MVFFLFCILVGRPMREAIAPPPPPPPPGYATACVSIRDFYHQKLLIFQNDSKIPIKKWIQQPNYTEWFIVHVAFGLPVSCGFTKHAYYSKTPHPAIFDCLPPSYKAALYVMFCLDGLIVFAIFVANILILIVVPKTNIAHTPHG